LFGSFLGFVSWFACFVTGFDVVGLLILVLCSFGFLVARLIGFWWLVYWLDRCVRWLAWLYG
jgi:hypothetical protein